MTAETYDFMRAGGWDAPPGERLPTLLAYLGVPSAPLAAQQEALRQWMAGPAYHGAPDYLQAECKAFLDKPPERAPQLESSPRNAQADRWQKRLDAWFPRGAVATWIQTAKTVPVAWIHVSGMEGLDPVLSFYHPFGWTKVKTLASTHIIRSKPHLIVQASFTDGSTVQLTAAVPDGLARDLAIARAQAQGQAVPQS